jgi:hypothetical protein
MCGSYGFSREAAVSPKLLREWYGGKGVLSVASSNLVMGFDIGSALTLISMGG